MVLGRTEVDSKTSGVIGSGNRHAIRTTRVVEVGCDCVKCSNYATTVTSVQRDHKQLGSGCLQGGDDFQCSSKDGAATNTKRGVPTAS